MTVTPTQYKKTRFDNRRPRATLGLWKRVLRDRHYRGPLHFAFEIEGRQIVCAYIRKNACTSFKKFLLAHAGVSTVPEGTRPIDVLPDHFRAEYVRDFVKADRTLFVHRDPIDRMVSLYKNKFIQAKDATDIHRDYEEVIGESADEATFESFVLRYLPVARDPHTRSQRSHLYASVYTDAIPIEALSDALYDVLPAEVIDRYFAHPVNVSGDQTYNDSAAPRAGARELRDELKRTGQYPSKDALAPHHGVLRQSLLAQYSVDLEFCHR